jgi:hypothetical protein
MSAISRLRRGARPKRMRASDATKIFDVIFVGLDAPHYGKVFAFANPAGRAVIGKVVPNFDIAWRPLSGDNATAFPHDWLEFNFVMANVVSYPEHRLPQSALEQCPLERCNADQLAGLMMAATNEQGGRAAYYSANKNQFIKVTLADQTQSVQQ